MHFIHSLYAIRQINLFTEFYTFTFAPLLAAPCSAALGACPPSMYYVVAIQYPARWRHMSSARLWALLTISSRPTCAVGDRLSLTKILRSWACSTTFSSQLLMKRRGADSCIPKFNTQHLSIDIPSYQSCPIYESSQCLLQTNHVYIISD